MKLSTDRCVCGDTRFEHVPNGGPGGPCASCTCAEFREPCCDMHNEHCEPPGDLCCWDCTEAAHDSFPVPHGDGSVCVLVPRSVR